MKAKIALITVLADDVPKMRAFYTNVLGFTVHPDSGTLEDYVEFSHEGVRFAICNRPTMFNATSHPSYQEAKRGQAFELAFPIDSPEEVDTTYAALVERGATPIQPPETMPWGMRTAFFADPEGNIHELFAYPPSPSN